MNEKTVRIEVWRGVVSEVKNLPKGWTYEVVEMNKSNLQ